ncbi:MAG TPA: hypothetical protein VGM94_02730 [Galbitalea sp.]|jgi:hypothetical protein
MTAIAAPSAPAILQPIGLELEVKSAQLTLDEGWSPYVQGSIVCELPTGDDRAAIDLRTSDLRVSIQLRRDFGRPWTIADLTALGGGSMAALTTLSSGLAANITHALYSAWVGSTERPAGLRNFDLYVLGRDLDDNAKELTLTVASDEALMIGDGLAASDPWDPNSTDLATIAQLILDRYAATLQTDPSTATVSEADATMWQPGTTAQKYFDALAEPASLRLWCDEKRRWHLTERQSPSDGNLAITPTTMVKSKDGMSLDPNVWADAVVVRYTWTDDLGASHTAYDPAGAQPAKALLPVERPNTIYPGAGAAAGILSRLQGRGRVLDVSLETVLSATPGQTTRITPPDTVSVIGSVASVTFRYPDDEMDLSSRGLVDVSPDSWLFGQIYDVTSADVETDHPTLAANAFTDWSQVL